MIKNLFPATLLVFLVFACAHAPNPAERKVSSAGVGDCRMTCAMHAEECASVCEGGDCPALCQQRGLSCIDRCASGVVASKASRCLEGCNSKANDCVEACNGAGECVNSCTWQGRACTDRCGF